MKRKQNIMFKSVVAVLLLFAVRSFPETNNSNNITNEFYIFIGNVERCKHIDWKDTSPPESISTSLPDGKIRLTVKGSLPLQYAGFVLENPDIFMVSDGIATNIYTDKKTLFMQNKRRKMRNEEGWRKICEQLVKSGEKKVFYGAPHQFPEELIKDCELEDFFIIEEYEGNFFNLPVPPEIRHKITRIRMEKHGIILPEKGKPEKNLPTHK